VTTRPTLSLAAVFLGVLACPHPLYAQQVFEIVGERALGMAGAFVAVADDATAVHWNPAGLVAGGPAGVTIGWNKLQFGNQEGPPVPGVLRRSTTFTSLGTWPLGLSYGQFRVTEVIAGRAGQGPSVASFTTRQFGVTILQTVAEGLVVGSTLKYVRGSLVTAPTAALTAAKALDEGTGLDGKSQGAFDLDLGVMADMERVRLGVTIKNLRQPEFRDVAGNAVRLSRLARLGVAVLPTDGLTLAMDIDLNTVDLRDGPRRMFALGGEGRLGPRLAVRAGVRWNLEGDRRPVGATGASVMIRPGLWLDGHFSQGRVNEAREFGVALRAGY
jgi:F plasmid transfer operon, TraF, protein